MAITPFKVIQSHQFDTNGKPVYDFPCVNNSNLYLIPHHFHDIIDNWWNFAVDEGVSL